MVKFIDNKLLKEGEAMKKYPNHCLEGFFTSGGISVIIN